MLKRILLPLLSFIVLSACVSQLSNSASGITVEMTDFAYNPSSITVPAGEPVALILQNTGHIEHDFVVEKIDATTTVIQDRGSEAHHAHGEEQNYDLHVSANAGDTSVIELTVSEPGTYRVFCSVEGHEEAGMIGELIVRAQD